MQRFLRILSAVGIVVSGMVVSGLAASTLPAGATTVSAGRTVPAGSVVITAFSQSGDYVGEGKANEFDPANIATVSGSAASSGINLSVIGGTNRLAWDFMVAPPRGSTFQVGVYTSVQRAEFRTGGHAGLDVDTDGRGCNTVTGSFEVRDLATSGSKITRLDLLYTQYCDGSTGALFGEIRIGEPQPGGLLLSSASVTWPPVWAGTPAIKVPLYIRNRGPKRLAVSAATLAGYAASDFQVTANGCSGEVLAPRASCSLSVSFASSVPGPRPAVLRIKVGQTWEQVQLDAPVPAGTTSLSTVSQPGDFVGEGKKRSFTPGNAGFFFAASPTGLAQYVRQNGGWVWIAGLAPAAGHKLAVGNYPGVSVNGPGNELDVTGNSHGCDNVTGSFRVKQAVFSGSRLEHFDATFTQHCEGAPPALTGEIKYASAPVVTAPPGVSRLAAAKSSAGKIALSWRNPAGSRYRYTVVRIEPYGAKGVSPSAGVAGYAGRGDSTTIGGLPASRRYVIVVCTVDQYGNVSRPAELTVRG